MNTLTNLLLSRKRFLQLLSLFCWLVMANTALADDGLDSGDTAWVITATALVLFMTIPGISLFYAGMVRRINVLSVLMQCFAITALITILWTIYGYSIAFGGSGLFWGGLDRVFLLGVDTDSLVGTIPETVYIMFQMTFAIIAPAIMVGAFAERMKFSALICAMALWFTFVYAPVAHWVWGEGGWLEGKGILDFAGGTVVHLNAGIAGLIAAIMIGKRIGYPRTPMPPHNLALTLIGAAFLWVGWFGFNAGSELAANGRTGWALITTQVASSAGALAWMCSEWIRHGKPSVLGIASGAIAGLVAITPAAGFVGPGGAIIIGLISGVCCYLCSTTLKRSLGYDDSFDVFGVHAIGAIVGAVLTGVFAAEIFGGFGLGEGIATISAQVGVQVLGVVVTILYAGILSIVIFKLIDWTIGLRVTEEQEIQGLDLSLHDERNYIL